MTPGDGYYEESQMEATAYRRGREDADHLTVLQPARAIVGHCPECSYLLVVLNNYEVWPWVKCSCGWGGVTGSIAGRQRFERGAVPS